MYARRAMPSDSASLPPTEARVPALRGAHALRPNDSAPPPAAFVARHWPEPQRRPISRRIVGFLLFVVVPTALAGVYYFAIAADQYVAEFRFGLRSPAPAPAAIAGLWPAAANSSAALDAAAIVQFIGSRAIVDRLDPQLDLRQMFSRRDADWPARLHLPAPTEELVRYWRRQVDAFDDTANGTVIVRVRAFTALDALVLAQSIAAASEELVNNLSARARRDTLRRAEEEAAKAEARLRTALARLREFRDAHGVIDPGKTAASTLELAGRVRDRLEQARAERATLRAYMAADAPSLKVIDARISSLEAELRALSAEVTVIDPKNEALSQVMGAYEELDSDRRFAEASYQHALEALDRARSEADRQQVYVASFVPPSLPEEALYPRRLRSFGVVALLSFAVWGIGCLVLQSVRDHLR